MAKACDLRLSIRDPNPDFSPGGEKSGLIGRIRRGAVSVDGVLRFLNLRGQVKIETDPWGEFLEQFPFRKEFQINLLKILCALNIGFAHVRQGVGSADAYGQQAFLLGISGVLVERRVGIMMKSNGSDNFLVQTPFLAFMSGTYLVASPMGSKVSSLNG